jgi:metal-responsive CopG/Arc/MetJ family transcriptional regulator
MSRSFVDLIDEVAKLTGSTRSDLVRRAVEHYITELKQANLISDLERREL